MCPKWKAPKWAFPKNEFFSSGLAKCKAFILIQGVLTWYNTIWAILRRKLSFFLYLKKRFWSYLESTILFSFWVWDHIKYVQFWNSGTIHSRVAQFCSSDILCWIMLPFEGCSVYCEMLAARLASIQCDKQKCLQPLSKVLGIGKWGESKLPLVKNQWSVVKSTFFKASDFTSEIFSLGIFFKIIFL